MKQQYQSSLPSFLHCGYNLSKHARNTIFWCSFGVITTIIVALQLTTIVPSNHHQFTTNPLPASSSSLSLSDSSLSREVGLSDLPILHQTLNINDLLQKYQYLAPEHRALQEFEQNATNLCGTYDNNFESYWRLAATQRSRANEDKLIYNLFFQQIQNLTYLSDFHYVELGAFDGITESNTRFYDTCLGWTGLLIEPNPKIYSQLVLNRPYAHRMSYAASCQDDVNIPNQTVTFYASWYTNSAEDNSPNRESYAGTNLATEVPCGSLQPVLTKVFPSKHIHFFSLDTEGVEYSILQTIDFNDIYIDIFIIENWNNFCTESCPGRDNVRTWMQSKGYVLYSETIPFSDLYVHPQSEFAHQIH